MFEKDTDTIEMSGEKGLFAYICRLYTASGEMVGEGRGAASLSEKTWMVNNAVKIAEKRAQIDAVLRTGALSDFFTQDLEDMDLSGGNDKVPQEAKNVELLTDKQMKFLFVLLKKLDRDKEWLEGQLGMSIENISKQKAKELLDEMTKTLENREETTEKVVDQDTGESGPAEKSSKQEQIQF